MGAKRLQALRPDTGRESISVSTTLTTRPTAPAKRLHHEIYHNSTALFKFDSLHALFCKPRASSEMDAAQ
jgi:hypothetical protein